MTLHTLVARLATLLVASSLAAAPYLFSRSLPQGSSTLGEVYQGAPPPSLFGPPSGTRIVMSSGTSVEAKMSTPGKRVRFYWRGEDGLGLNQIVETSFYPTSIRWIARNGGIRFVVSGKRPLTWTTVVEEWTLEEPKVLVEASLGVKHFGRARVRQVTSIYDAAVPGRDMVLASWRLGVTVSTRIGCSCSSGTVATCMRSTWTRAGSRFWLPLWKDMRRFGNQISQRTRTGAIPGSGRGGTTLLSA